MTASSQRHKKTTGARADESHLPSGPLRPGKTHRERPERRAGGEEEEEEEVPPQGEGRQTPDAGGGKGFGASSGATTMASSAMQILAFALSLLGVLGATLATLLPNWKVSADVGSNIMTAISQMQGLWMDCTWYSTGVFSCTLKYSVLSLPAYLQTARTTMVLSCMMASLGLCLAALGLKCTRWGGSHRAKARAAVAAGGCFVLAGVLCLVPASWFTNEVITSFMDANVPESSKYEPGGAVYVTFVSAGFLLAGGAIFCLSCPGKREGGPLDYAASASMDPDKLMRLRQEQLHREQLQREQLHREQESRDQQMLLERSSRETPPAQDKVQPDVDVDKPSQEKPHQDGEQQYYSPSKVPPKDVRAGYSLQDYV